MEEKSDISKLIELKKYEQPEEGFFDDFLADFRKRQRREVMEVSARSLLLERLAAHFRQWGKMQWASVSALAMAVVVAGIAWAGKNADSRKISETQTHSEPTAVAATPTPAQATVFVQTHYADAASDVEFVFVDLSEESSSRDVEF